MALIRKIDGVGPVIGENVFIAENAAVLGDVRIARDASIWYGAVLRGDAGSITIGERSNVQDGVVIHATQGESTTVIGRDVTIGHNAVVHGARIGNDVLIGMGAVVLGTRRDYRGGWGCRLVERGSGTWNLCRDSGQESQRGVRGNDPDDP